MHRTDASRLLGVHPTASPAEVRKAFRRHLGGAHPDRGGDPTELRRLVEARDLLLEQPRPTGYRRPSPPVIVRRRRNRVDLLLDRLLGGRRPPRDLA